MRLQHASHQVSTHIDILGNLIRRAYLGDRQSVFAFSLSSMVSLRVLGKPRWYFARSGLAIVGFRLCSLSGDSVISERQRIKIVAELKTPSLGTRQKAIFCFQNEISSSTTHTSHPAPLPGTTTVSSQSLSWHLREFSFSAKLYWYLRCAA